MLSQIADTAYRILLAAVTILIFLIAGRFVQMVIARLLQELNLDYLLEKIGVEFSGSKVIGTVAAFVLYLWGILIALKQLGLERIAFFIAAAAGAILILLSLVLGVTDIIKNFTIGLYLRKKYLGKKELRIGNMKCRIIYAGRTKIKVMTGRKEALVIPYEALKRGRFQ
jgi:hypothetical protein